MKNVLIILVATVSLSFCSTLTDNTKESKNQNHEEFFKTNIVNELKNYGDCLKYTLCKKDEEKVDLVHSLEKVLLVPNSNKIYFITYTTKAGNGCRGCSVSTNVFLYEKINDKYNLIAKSINLDVPSFWGEAPNFEVKEIGKNNYALTTEVGFGQGGYSEEYLYIFIEKNRILEKIGAILINSTSESNGVYKTSESKYSFIKSNKKYFDIKLVTENFVETKKVNTENETYIYKNHKYTIKK